MTERGNDWKLDKGLEESSGGAELEYRVVRIFRKNALFRRTPKPTTKLGWYHNIKYDTDYQYTHHGSRHVLLSSGKETTMSCKATCRKLVGTCRDLSEVVGSCRKLSEVVGSCRKLSEVVGSCRNLSEACRKLVGSLSEACRKLVGSPDKPGRPDKPAKLAKLAKLAIRHEGSDIRPKP
jgi:hypothetical protein